MTKQKILISIAFLLALNLQSQYLSNLKATRNSPIFTTYAAPMESSNYVLDQGYRFMWTHPQEPLGFTTQHAGVLFLAFEKDQEFKWQSGNFHKQAIITTSYSDLMQYSFYPFENIRINCFFNVYNSQTIIWEIEVINEGSFSETIQIHPVFDGADIRINNIEFYEDAFTFEYLRPKDGWMENHDIPLVEDITSCFHTTLPVISRKAFLEFEDFVSAREASRGRSANFEEDARVLIFSHALELTPGERCSFRLIRSQARQHVKNTDLIQQCKNASKADIIKRLSKNEAIYQKIPQLHFEDEDYEAVYWNAYNLIRQCMMPPEGECSYNYYVFSREPAWGWGYGGQVFHESLVMLAYAFMDPESAMNSQRVYMERQDTSGFINYRTGPYLNENIPYNNQVTSSAPWYNYQNYEIYKITHDREFLKEAYQSGKKYYDYYIANRDADNDGLAEWGAHAVLESVRDARVAVWDKVGWPSNFEGPDINSMLIMEARSLAQMAKELGYASASLKYQADADKRIALINQYLWDQETAFFYNVDMKDNDFSFKEKNDLKIKEIIGFLPLWAGAISQSRADSLVNSLFNKQKFWRNYGIPTLSAGHPYYNPIGYWNGPVWVQWNYLIFRGLLDYGYRMEAKILAEKVLDNIAYHLKKDHTFWEFYSADDLQAGWNHAYIWTGITARFLIDLEREGLLD